MWSVERLAWPLVLLLFLVHGTCSSFLVNSFHELVHDSVFKTRWLNRAFLWVFAFWGWYSHIHFWASHTAHHKYTLHPPDDLEVVLPTRITLRTFLRLAAVDLVGMAHTARSNARWCLGRVQGEWESRLFPESDPVQRRRLFNWARILVLGHGVIVVTCLAFGWWAVPLVTTLTRFYAGGTQHLCNVAQHVGLRDNVADYRLSTRTIILDPILRFLYLAHEFPHRASHVRGGTVLPAGPAAQADPSRPAAESARADRDLERHHRDSAPTKVGSHVSVPRRGTGIRAAAGARLSDECKRPHHHSAAVRSGAGAAARPRADGDCRQERGRGRGRGVHHRPTPRWPGLPRS